MTKTLRTHRLAEDKLTDAAIWYESKQPGLGASFLDLVDSVINRLCSGRLPDSPVPGVETIKKVRRILLKRFPYSIVFLERETEIVIIAFAHSSRHPGYWRSREF